jgi:hypothetical protein
MIVRSILAVVALVAVAFTPLRVSGQELNMPMSFDFLVTKDGYSGMELVADTSEVTIEHIAFLAGDCGSKALSTSSFPVTLKYQESIRVLSNRKCRLTKVLVSTDRGDWEIRRK